MEARVWLCDPDHEQPSVASAVVPIFVVLLGILVTGLSAEHIAIFR